MPYFPGCRSISRRVLALSFAALFLSSTAFAQVDTGIVQGTVRDSTGAVVPGASVTLINVDMGVSFETKTNGVGNYQFASIRIGRYTVVAEAPGFAPATREGVTLNIQQRYVADFSLTPSSVAETVNVTAEAVQLQTQEASLGASIQAKTIDDLPLNGNLGAGRNHDLPIRGARGMLRPHGTADSADRGGRETPTGLWHCVATKQRLPGGPIAWPAWPQPDHQ